MGSGPGEFRTPGLLALAPSGSILGVYDLLKNEVQFIAPNGEYQGKQRVRGLMFPKGFAISDGGLVVLTGGSGIPRETQEGVHWAAPPDSFWSTPPSAPSEGPMESHPYVAGRPVFLSGDTAYVADAATGDVWLAHGDGAHLVARGPGAVPDLMGHIVRSESINGRPARGIWWTFPRAVYLEARPDGFLVGWADADRSLFRFLLEGSGAPPRTIGEWKIAVTHICRFDNETFIVVGLDANQDISVSRVRLPLRQ